MNSKTKKIALYGMCIAVAFILSYLETLIPIQGFVPGMKLGLTNLVVVFALYYLDWKAAAVINIVRIFLVGVTFGNSVSLLYSLAGGMLAFISMVLLKYSKWFHMVAVSVAGSVCHNAGQILVAMLLLKTTMVGWYFGILCISGVGSGVLIGILTGMVMSKFPKKELLEN